MPGRFIGIHAQHQDSWVALVVVLVIHNGTEWQPRQHLLTISGPMNVTAVMRTSECGLTCLQPQACKSIIQQHHNSPTLTCPLTPSPTCQGTAHPDATRGITHAGPPHPPAVELRAILQAPEPHCAI